MDTRGEFFAFGECETNSVPSVGAVHIVLVDESYDDDHHESYDEDHLFSVWVFVVMISKIS